MHDDTERMNNGVKIRVDGGGDEWAKQHRELGSKFYMQDIDGFAGFADDAEDGLFFEYEPDSYQNHGKTRREFGVVAMFDRKNSWDAADASRNTLSKAFHMYLARALSSSQRKPARFFYVVGGSSEKEWEMREVCIETGDWIGGVVIVNGASWIETWVKIGLTSYRSLVRPK